MIDTSHYAYSAKRRHYFDHLLALKSPCGTMHMADPRNVARICREATEAGHARHEALALEMGISPTSALGVHCMGCRTAFTALTAFDMHRTGRGTGRRCLTAPEMEIAGMARLSSGRWASEAPGTRPQPVRAKISAVFAAYPPLSTP